MAPKNAEEDEIDLNDGTSCPQEPLSLEITDFDASSASFKWKAPLSDGGSPVNGYILQSRKAKGKDNEWVSGDKIKPTKYLNGKLSDLESGTRYEFRVCATNRVGSGPPSDITFPLIVKAQRAPPEIQRKSLPEKKSVKVNQQFVLEVPVEGAPQPEVSWFHGETQIQPSLNIKISHHQNIAKIIFLPARRELSGPYTIKAVNLHGEDSVEFLLDVWGSPSPPKGPLGVSEVTKKTCFLQWGFPEDDGGRQIANFEVEKLDVTKGGDSGSWLPCGTAKGLSYRVGNLIEGHVYRFSVRAVNTAEYESKPIQTEEDVLAKNPFDPPSCPGKPKLLDWGEDWADLEWSAPQEDGGIEIMEYFVEIRNTGKRNWVQGSITKSVSCSIPGGSGLIQSGNDYQFRVAAKNKGGELSEFSPTSSPITAEVRFIKPKIDRDMLIKEKILHAGQTLRLELSVVSAPLAEIAWHYPNGSKVVPLKEGPKIWSLIDNYGLVSLSIENIRRSDAGIFKCIASNSEGFDEVQVRVDVMDVPSPPIGPLSVTDVSSESCKVHFKKPADVGGMPLTGYVVERRVKGKEAWVACGKANNKTLLIMRDVEVDVKDLLEGQTYIFRVLAFNANGESDPLESNLAITAQASFEVPFPPFTPMIIDWDKKWIQLAWSVGDADAIRHFIIEAQEQFLVPKSSSDKKKKRKHKKKKRSVDSDEEEESSSEDEPEEIEEESLAEKRSSKSFHKEMVEYCTQWTKVLVTEDNDCETKVENLTEGTKYRFRVKAVNNAGASMPSEETETIVCRVKKQRPRIDRSSINTEVFVPLGQNISLFAKVEGEPQPDILWTYGGKIEIKQSMSIDINNKASSSKLTLFGGRKDDTGTYTMKASNKHGEDTIEFHVIVVVCPERPKGPLKIYAVNAQGCKAEWNLPEYDGGSSITHYIIEKINKSHSEWMPCGRTTEPSATIVGLTPGKEYRLRVRAVNNEGESDPLEGVDSFITENPWSPPSSPDRPVLNDYDHDYIQIKWNPPKKDGGSRVTGYQVQIRPWRGSEWQFGEDVKGQLERTTLEQDLRLGQTYATRVRAVNSAGVSPWSIESDALTLKYKALPPKISLDFHNLLEGKNTIVIKAGETLSVDAKIPSEPPSDDVKWFLGNKELVDDPLSGIYVDNSIAYASNLRKTGICRRDEGTLLCKASNIHGKDSIKYGVRVISSPSSPGGTLDVSGVHKNGCRLAWESPKDTGGLPVEYEVDIYLVKASAWTTHWKTKKLFMELNDLEEGHEYEFGVRALNELGESPLLTTTKSFIIKDQFTVPLSTYTPEVVDWSERHMELIWREPIDDGGAPIHGYHIETKSRDTHDEWQLWETIDSNTCNAKLMNLRQGISYQFRVIAINKAGKSEASLPSRSKEAQPKTLLPLINTKSLHDVTVEVGSRVKFDLPISGVPFPSVEWLHKESESPITSDKSIHIENTEDSSSRIIFNCVRRSDEGTYVITVENSSGTDSAHFKLNVLDRPDAPEGLNASVLKPEEPGLHPLISLVWKRSKYDGGSAIEYYQVEKYETDKLSWMAIGRTKENTLEVKGLFNPGETYVFKVSTVNQLGESDAIEVSVHIPEEL
eukprot:TRINITY_DN878_c0_g1_i1.p1 TRINITY_DN878_c0_g1~~TRINITY_DN878_c0_g1_i1.p1  ORF type:complete len:1596 (-),score=294.53 TRINITY_DN878_c0_g1_i1:195-4982(-)